MLRTQPAKQLIYLDHAATTPVRPGVFRAMQPFLTKKFGNPSSLYRAGVEAKQALEVARKTIADLLYVQPKEIVFTAGGTESVNLAILGTAKHYRKQHKTGGHVITTAIEHHAVLHAVKALEDQGFKTTYLKVDKQGFVNPADVQNAIRKDTFLVSIMYANNEVGTVQSIAQIGSIIRKVNREKIGSQILFHSDGCQAGGFLNLNMQKLGVDAFSLNASKIYGPKQVGVLFVRTGVKLLPLIYGGEQERNLRSGTENVAGAVGLSKALELSQQEKTVESPRLVKLRNAFAEKVLKQIPNSFLNGPQLTSSSRGYPLRGSDSRKRGVGGEDYRLPNNLNFTFKGAEGEAVMLYLDALNIAVSTGSACASESQDPSHVLKAIGLSDRDARDSIRITLGRSTTKQQLDFTLKALKEVVKVVRAM